MVLVNSKATSFPCDGGGGGIKILTAIYSRRKKHKTVMSQFDDTILVDLWKNLILFRSYFKMISSSEDFDFCTVSSSLF